MNYDNVNTCVAPILNNDCCVKSTPMDITDLSSNITRNLEFEKRILKKLLFIADRLGC